MTNFVRTVLFIYTLCGYMVAVNDVLAHRCTNAEGFFYRFILWPLVILNRVRKELL